MMGFFQAFGMAPYTPMRIAESMLSKNGTWQTSMSIKFKSSGLCTLYNICLVIADLWIIYVAAPVTWHDDYLRQSSVTYAIRIFGCSLGFSTTFIIWIVLTLHRETLANILNCLVNVDVILESLSNRDTTDSFPFHYLILIIWNVILRVTSIYYNAKPRFLDHFIYGFPGYIVSTFIIQYTVAIKVLENRFRAINRILDRYGFEMSSDLEDRLCLTSELSTSAEKMGAISKLKLAHANLIKIGRRLNNVNSVPILLAVAFECTMFTYAAYFYAVTFLLNTSNPTGLVTTTTFAWLSSKLVPVPGLAIAISSLITEVVTLRIHQVLIFYSNSN